MEITRREGDSELLDGGHNGVRVTVEHNPCERRSWSGGQNRAQPLVEVSRWSPFNRGRGNFVIYSLSFFEFLFSLDIKIPEGTDDDDDDDRKQLFLIVDRENCFINYDLNNLNFIFWLEKKRVALELYITFFFL